MMKSISDFEKKLAFIILGVAFCSSIFGCSFIERNTSGLFSSGESQESGDYEESLVGEDGSVTEESGVGTSAAVVPNTAKVKIGALDKGKISKERPAKPGIELIWKAGEDRPDAYVIYYGYSEDNLQFEKSLEVEDVEVIDDKEFGKVNRYLLSGTDPDKATFVSISAVKNSLVSEPSPVMEVPAKR